MALNAALTSLIAQAETATLGYLVIDEDVLDTLYAAAALATPPTKRARRRNPEAARHISFLLRQKAVDMAYASVGR